ncbi:hypothetical protein ACEPAI_4341 [Sanghuangporus weigelae]
MSGSEVISKRLHVSGLTPQTSAADLTSRFSSFGIVKALDGLGKLDALGQPRPYAYVTIETTKSQLAKCLNLLSGTTWKGAKLRIGEAKPDFRERINRENESVNDSVNRPTKRRRLARGVQGVHAADMSLVSPTSLRSGWRITPLGRLVRPMRMRPLCPLPNPVYSAAQKQLVKVKRRKARNKTLLRARRRKIDPEEWGSTYMRGIMLDNGNGIILPDKSSSEKAHENELALEQHPKVVVSNHTHRLSPSLSPRPTSSSLPVDFDAGIIADEPHHVEQQPEIGMDLAEEKTRSLALLDSLFGSGTARNKSGDNDDWGGVESLSDLDIDVEKSGSLMAAEEPNAEGDGIEYVPRSTRIESMSEPREHGEAITVTEKTASPRDYRGTADEVTQSETIASVQTAKLKDMFAPRPEDAGFSILDNLDLELDEELPTISAPPLPVQPPSDSDLLQPTMGAPSALPHQPMVEFDPKRPFFFPHSLLPNSSLDLKPGDPRDIFSGKIEFFRTETDEEIQARWESRKVELTRDWKRRHREAVKSARRRGGIQD